MSVWEKLSDWKEQRLEVESVGAKCYIMPYYDAHIVKL